jgi:hypothetical protein
MPKAKMLVGLDLVVPASLLIKGLSAGEPDGGVYTK